MRHAPLLRISSLLLLVSSLAACNSNESGPPTTGNVTPTVAGGSATTGFAGYQEAKEAFTRGSEDGVLIATLEDAAWLRFEGSPEEVQENHKAYFEYGYTSFKVILRAREFTRPTTETFILEDSAGARISARPVTFNGNLITVDDRWQYEFDLAFRHTITRDVQWIKLTRAIDGEYVEWTLK